MTAEIDKNGQITISAQTPLGAFTLNVKTTELVVDKNNDIPSAIQWVEITDKLPKHGEIVLTYTPTTEIVEEQMRLIRYGSLKRGFPSGITHWKYLDKPTCLK